MFGKIYCCRFAEVLTKINMMNIGKLKAIIDRELSYISKFNFVMIAYIFFKDIGFKGWYLLAIPVFLVWVFIDLKYVMPKEHEYIHGKSPILKKIMQQTSNQKK